MSLKYETIVRILNAEDANNARILVLCQAVGDLVVDLDEVFLFVLGEPKWKVDKLEKNIL